MTTVPNPLLILAMDHRAVMRGLFGAAVPEELRVEAFGRAKGLAFDALLQVLADEDADPAAFGVLIDEEYGAAVVPRVREAGCHLVLPVEASRSPVFDIDTAEFALEHGDGFRERLDASDPDMVKALIVHNPDLPAERRTRQTARARAVLEWCLERAKPFMLELLVPPTDAQLAAVGGDRTVWQRELHAEALSRSVIEYQEAGVWPHVWKLEPLADPASYARISELCRRDAPHDTSLVLLGGGADIEAVETWVGQIRGVPGFTGFAIGRSLWSEAFTGYFAGRLGEAEVTAAVADRLRRLVKAYQPATAP